MDEQLGESDLSYLGDDDMEVLLRKDTCRNGGSIL